MTLCRCLMAVYVVTKKGVDILAGGFPVAPRVRAAACAAAHGPRMRHSADLRFCERARIHLRRERARTHLRKGTDLSVP